jgi:hypothetical protein
VHKRGRISNDKSRILSLSTGNLPVSTPRLRGLGFGRKIVVLLISRLLGPFIVNLDVMVQVGHHEAVTRTER